MAKKGSTKSPKKNKNVTTTTEVTVIPGNELSLDVDENKIILTPQQAFFMSCYSDPDSPTWGNAKQSAIRAGFSVEYANTITYLRPKWLSEFIGQQNLIKKIEGNFDDVLNMPNVSQAIGMTGPIFRTEIRIEETGEVYKTGKRAGQNKTRKIKEKVPVMVPNLKLIKEKIAIAKLAAPAHDPDRYGRKPANNNKFVFNMAPIKERYKT